MKRAVSLAALVLLVVVASLMAADKTVTVKGELVDTLCYASMGAKGEGHMKCAIACAKKGIPVGLVEEGKTSKMYVLLPPKDAAGLPAAVTDHMGKVVSVTATPTRAAGTAS